MPNDRDSVDLSARTLLTSYSPQPALYPSKPAGLLEAGGDILREGAPRCTLDGMTCGFQALPRQLFEWALEARHLLWLLEPSGTCQARVLHRGISVEEYRSHATRGRRSASTQARLDACVRALVEQRARLADILAPLRPEQVPEWVLSERVRSRGRDYPRLWDHFDYLHRDWAWGDREIEDALNAVLALLEPGDRVGMMLVPGAGACRLAHELHLAVSCKRTVVTDINPLLFLCARRIIAGESLTLYELPQCPLDLESCAVRRELSARRPGLDGLEFVLTDFTTMLLRPAIFDVVFTHWFIDAVRLHMDHVVRGVNHVLRPGGVWINLGPTIFMQPLELSSPEEILDSLWRNGFCVERTSSKFFATLNSPASASHRRDRLFGFRALKTAEVDPPMDVHDS